MVLADAEPKRTDNRDHVPRKGKATGALEHRDERRMSRYIPPLVVNTGALITAPETHHLFADGRVLIYG